MNNQKYIQEVENLKDNSCFRELKDLNFENKFINFQEKKMLNTASNDYLGLANNEELKSEFFNKLLTENLDFSFGATSSRLLTGNHFAYSLLENNLKKAYKKEACLIFNSGYHANIGILPALSTKKDLIIADKLVHASIIDGIKLSDANFMRYKHTDYEHLEQILEKNRILYDNVFIVTESIFSMDGDYADLNKICELKYKYDAYLIVDEAHGVGVRGEKGLGVAEEQNCIESIDFLIGTFGKAFASQGAFVVCENIFKNIFINKTRSLIFTTALPSINILWTNFIFEKIEYFNDKRNHLKKISDLLRKNIENSKYKTSGSSHIIPLFIGENKKCIEISEYFKNFGFWAMPVRYPTVQKGTERIRFSLTANITEIEIENLSNLITEGLCKL